MRCNVFTRCHLMKAKGSEGAHIQGDVAELRHCPAQIIWVDVRLVHHHFKQHKASGRLGWSLWSSGWTQRHGIKYQGLSCLSTAPRFQMPLSSHGYRRWQSLSGESYSAFILKRLQHNHFKALDHDARLLSSTVLTGLMPDAEATAAVGFPRTCPSDSTRDSTFTIEWRDSVQKARGDRWGHATKWLVG